MLAHRLALMKQNVVPPLLFWVSYLLMSAMHT